MANITIRDIKHRDVSKCECIWESTMSSGWVNSVFLKSCASGRSGYKTFVAIDNSSDEVLGFCGARVDVLDNVIKASPSVQKDIKSHLDVNGQEKVRYLEIIAVDPDHQGKGVASKLMGRMATYLQNVDTRLPIVTETWIRDGHTDGQDIARSTELLQKVVESDQYWDEDGYCPECECDPCECSGGFFKA